MPHHVELCKLTTGSDVNVSTDMDQSSKKHWVAYGTIAAPCVLFRLKRYVCILLEDHLHWSLSVTVVVTEYITKPKKVIYCLGPF